MSVPASHELRGVGQSREIASALEAGTRRVGRRLLRRAMSCRPSRWSPKGFEDYLMELGLSDQAAHTALLRLVDVFPALRSSNEITQHLLDYLGDLDRGPGVSALSRILSSGARAAHVFEPLGWLGAELASWGVLRMARRFIVESSRRNIVACLRSLEETGALFTLDVLGEAVHSDEEARRFLSRYTELVVQLEEWLGPRAAAARKGTGPRVNLSVKISSMTAHFEPADPDGSASEAKERLRELCRAAKKAGAFVNVDMESYRYRDLTTRVFREVLAEEEFRDWPDVGIVVQAYLRDARGALDDLLDWVRRRGTEITVRLVKGAYWDSEQIWARQKNWPIPVHLYKARTDAQFEQLAEVLLKNHNLVRTAIGSHNARSISHALMAARSCGAGEGRLEIQMLHGMAEPLRSAVSEEGVPVRVYVPVGELIPGMAYFVRRLLENSSQNSFVRQMNMGRAEIHGLLENPAELIAHEEKAQ